MIRKFLSITAVLILSLILLTGCEGFEIVFDGGSNDPEETTGPTYPEGAILPACDGENASIKSREIRLTDFTLTIPEGYVYGEKEHEGYKTYFVWMDEEGKDYATETDTDVMLYIFDGIDENSPHQEITEDQAQRSAETYMRYMEELMDGNLKDDVRGVLNRDESLYVSCFTGYGGEDIDTTYGVSCYPKTYYGMFAVQFTTTTKCRQFYGFCFSNNGEGEIFKESEYTYLLEEIKSKLNVEKLYTRHQTEDDYDPLRDVSNGRSYEQMLILFDNTYIYYVETMNKPYERQNVDRGPVPTETLIPETEPEETTEGTEVTDPEATGESETAAPTGEAFNPGSEETMPTTEATEVTGNAEGTEPPLPTLKPTPDREKREEQSVD